MAGEDLEYVRWVKSYHRCRMHLHDPCSGGFPDAHHTGERGLGQRAHDRTVVPLCRRHHSAWHDCNGVFRGWTKTERADWAAKQVRRLREMYAAFRRAEADGGGLV